MKVILTHQNADCDAVASLLAMHKLHPDAIPVLPSSINRNIAQFLLLYDRHWPFTHLDDLPRNQKVSQALVVDTQRFNMVRGMTAQTPVSILDHHPLTRPLPDHQHYRGDPLGANITLLVEDLIQQTVALETPEATLFLLGLYEDTGSLSYKSTTPRDLVAGAWLLEQSGDLDVVRQFLQPPMNPDQTDLLQRLQNDALTLTIEGHAVVIAAVVLHTSVTEVAAIVRELLELFGCDAIIAVLQVGANVQLIARAKVDDIQLGGLMSHFGGSGHSRAAAALARQTDLRQVISRLVDLLPTYTQPTMTVASLMSLGVQTLDSQTSIAQAQAAMHKTGHEGYPVLEGGRVVGLLTRRAVDRAILHDMHKQPIRQIMEQGEYSVSPQDSVETLKDRMLATQWGQLPVVDAGGLVGIVTRTDLIKHWGHKTESPAQERLAYFRQTLSESLWQLLERISTLAEAQQKGLYLVGGIVRDLLLNQPNWDIDLVVEGDAIGLARALQGRYGGDLHPHPQFSTATWVLTPTALEALGLAGAQLPSLIDFATSRAEFYDAPTALPTIWRGSIKLDLHRRDFSINALALRLAPGPMGQLLDFYNGERDLQAGLIRVLHSLSFIDDPTRMLRAVRFEQRFGFEIESRTLSLIEAALPLLDRLSGERLRNELDLILSEANPLANLERLEDLGMLPHIFPALALSEPIRAALGRLQTIRPSPPWAMSSAFDWVMLHWAILSHALTPEQVAALSARLSLTRATQQAIQHTQTGYQQRDQLLQGSPSQIVRAWEGLGEVAWFANWLLGDEAHQTALVRLARDWRQVSNHLRGDDLKQMGLPSGPWMGQLLWELRAAWLDGAVESVDAERELAQRRIEALQANPGDSFSLGPRR
jgi:tRNA nucleotidyltransferase (CCA-adding enzyme)